MPMKADDGSLSLLIGPMPDGPAYRISLPSLSRATQSEYVLHSSPSVAPETAAEFCWIDWESVAPPYTAASAARIVAS